MRAFNDLRSDARVSAVAEDLVVMDGGTFSWKLLELVDANSVPLLEGEDDAASVSKLSPVPSLTPRNKPSATTVDTPTEDAPTITPCFLRSITSDNTLFSSWYVDPPSSRFGSVPPNQLNNAIEKDKPADRKQKRQEACNTPTSNDTR